MKSFEYFYVAVLLLSSVTMAETVIDFSVDHSKGVFLASGMDYAVIVFRLGYAHSLHLPTLKRSLVLDAAFSTLLAALDFGDFMIQTGGSIHTLTAERFRMPVSVIVRIDHSFHLRGRQT